MDDHLEEEAEQETAANETPRFLQPRVFDGAFREDIPPGFDAVTIRLDGRVKADLDWKGAQKEAQRAIEHGYTLLWDIQLGLFEGLKQPLVNQSQFLSLALSLEHFRDSLWKEFQAHTIGASLYRGGADFSRGFSWDSIQEENFKRWLQEIDPRFDSLSLSEIKKEEEGARLIPLFCRDVAIEYLALLGSRLPDSLHPYLYLDLSTFAGSLIDQISLLNPDRYSRFHLALKGSSLPFDAWGWGTPSPQGYCGTFQGELPPLIPATVAICIPPMNFYTSRHFQGLDLAIQKLQNQSIPFRLISETHLTYQWDDLDIIIYCPTGLSKEGKRKLHGFCAAGGTVVSTGYVQGFPNESTLSEYFNSLQTL
jgi:hypothetical protein